MKKLNICVVGLGYIGLPTAALLASAGFQVAGVDISESVIKTLRAGKTHITEPGLDELVREVIMGGQLTVSLTPQPADIFLITVPTPFSDDKQPDLTYIERAVHSIAPVLTSASLIILESTSPVGTAEQVSVWLKMLRPDLLELLVAYCPERVIPGAVLRELVENDRVVGGVIPAATEKAVQFYQMFVKGRVIPTSAKTAEMCKLSENAFRDVNIAFANELSIICDQHGVDVWELIQLANHHPRVDILQPGPGVGGHCIAVDPWFIVASANNNAQLIKQARLTNDAKPVWVVDKVKSAAENFVKPVIACLGLAYKPNIDDLRESPAVQITQQLIAASIGEIIACEPHIFSLDWVKLMPLTEVLLAADIILILVDHDLFKEVDWSHYQEKHVIDTRGLTQYKNLVTAN